MFLYLSLSYFVLFLHLALSAFLILSPFLILMGWAVDSPWIHIAMLRKIQLGLLILIGLEVIFSQPCPLMTWEDKLRVKAGKSPRYTTGFFDYWVERGLKIRFKDWMFNSALTLLLLLSFFEYMLIP
ncbi:MAG: DUF2784 family protein [Oligoflexales bacterium]|nr:DUF2784 family protein [Oligoflexales bacterium]